MFTVYILSEMKYNVKYNINKILYNNNNLFLQICLKLKLDYCSKKKDV